MQHLQPLQCQNDMTETVIKLKLEFAQASFGLDSSLHSCRSALNNMLVLRSQMEHFVLDKEQLSIKVDHSNTSIFKEENMTSRTILDEIKRDRDTWMYREGQLTSELKQTKQLLERQINKSKR